VGADLDCDDNMALRHPEAGYGLAASSNPDRNCDGKVEAQYEFVDSNNVYYKAGTLPPLCSSSTECSCLAQFAFFKGYRGLDRATGRVDADFSAAIYDYVAMPPPCAGASSDVIGAIPLPPGPECRDGSTASINVVLRKLCR
jgi:hypothetical protein